MGIIQNVLNSKTAERLRRSLLLKSGIYCKIKRLSPTVSEDFRIVKLLKAYNIDKVLDVGGNTGQFAESLLDFGYNGKIVSFEPVLHPYHIISERSKKYKNWTIAERGAIGDTNGEIQINVSEATDFSSIKTIKDEYVSGKESAKIVKTETIQINTLDSLFRKYYSDNERILLKIDTQGYEQEVLNGSTQLLQKVVGVKLEVPMSKENALYDNVEMDIYDYLRFFGERNFECVSIEGISADKQTGKMYEADVVFMRK